MRVKKALAVGALLASSAATAAEIGQYSQLTKPDQNLVTIKLLEAPSRRFECDGEYAIASTIYYADVRIVKDFAEGCWKAPTGESRVIIRMFRFSDDSEDVLSVDREEIETQPGFTNWEDYNTDRYSSRMR